jgi:hypothetical protein
VIEPEFVQAIQNLNNLDESNIKFAIRIQTENNTIVSVSENKKRMPVHVKYFRKDDNFKMNATICSKLLYLKPEYIKTINWWIELNNMHGYDKLVIYNNSLPSQLDKMFARYSNFIEVIQFQCIPNFMDDNNRAKPYIKSFYEFKNVYKTDPLYYHMHFEFFTLNECYLQNMDKYVHVTVIDQDESIVPRRLSKFKKLTNDLDVNLDDLKNDICSNSSPNIVTYLTR